MSTDGKVSRRTWLRKTALFTAAAGVPSRLESISFAQEKASKSTVHYRDYPKQMQMCGMRKFFEGGEMMGGRMMGCGMMGHGMMAGACEVVEGQISAMGWCDLYAPRGA